MPPAWLPGLVALLGLLLLVVAAEKPPAAELGRAMLWTGLLVALLVLTHAR